MGVAQGRCGGATAEKAVPFPERSPSIPSFVLLRSLLRQNQVCHG
jgi:hypothetical protein